MSDSPAGTATEALPVTLAFGNAGLPDALVRATRELGFDQCTAIQAITLPEIAAGHDIAAQAQTGTGKTAAFLLGAFARLMRIDAGERRQNQPRMLVIAPTRELAIQIKKDADDLGRYTGLSSALAYGGIDYEKQRKAIEAGVDVLIGTPGRLIDYFKQKVFDLKKLEIVVLDEADRMFDLGFITDIRFLLRRMPEPAERTSMLFSATLSHRVMELAYEHMNSPKALTVLAESVTADGVNQTLYQPASDEKIPLLLGLLKQMQPERSIVFVNTKRVAEQVEEFLLGNGFHCGTLSGDVRQNKRQKIIEQFSSGALPILIATDVAARGLHIDDVSHVFNYDLPQQAEDYVHRIGRTARAGTRGEAVSFACEKYSFSLPEIQDYIDQRIPLGTITDELLVKPKPRKRVERDRVERPGDNRGKDGRGKDGRSKDGRGKGVRGKDVGGRSGRTSTVGRSKTPDTRRHAAEPGSDPAAPEQAVPDPLELDQPAPEPPAPDQPSDTAGRRPKSRRKPARKEAVEEAEDTGAESASDIPSQPGVAAKTAVDSDTDSSTQTPPERSIDHMPDSTTENAAGNVPESISEIPPKTTRSRTKKPANAASDETETTLSKGPETGAAIGVESGDEAAPRKRRRRRKPRPKAGEGPEAGSGEQPASVAARESGSESNTDRDPASGARKKRRRRRRPDGASTQSAAHNGEPRAASGERSPRASGAARPPRGNSAQTGSRMSGTGAAKARGPRKRPFDPDAQPGNQFTQPNARRGSGNNKKPARRKYPLDEHGDVNGNVAPLPTPDKPDIGNY